MLLHCTGYSSFFNLLVFLLSEGTLFHGGGISSSIKKCLQNKTKSVQSRERGKNFPSFIPPSSLLSPILPSIPFHFQPRFPYLHSLSLIRFYISLLSHLQFEINTTFYLCNPLLFALCFPHFQLYLYHAGSQLQGGTQLEQIKFR